MDSIVEVAVPSPLYRRFDYRVDRPELARPGMRVEVPFGKRRVVGIILACLEHSDVPEARLRMARLLDQEPVLDARLLELLRFAARYYQHPVGEAMACALPVALRRPGPLPDLRPPRWRLTDAGRQAAAEPPPRAPRQVRVLRALAAQPAGLPRPELDVPASVLRRLAERGWIEPAPAETPPAAVPDWSRRTPPHALNPAQQAAVEAILAERARFAAFLLDGVTGSGKTEVYLHAIEPLLAAGRQTLVLVPEIGLTPQLLARFRERFDVPIALLHSGLGDRERLAAWQEAASGRAGIVLGTRSAVFTPLPRPGLILVDEEHDASLKQHDGLRYSARDLAVWRARQLGVPVVLGSATPSLESLYNLRLGRYRHLHLPERAGCARPAPLQVLDLRGQPMRGLLSLALRERMRHHLEQDGQVLLFLNRRGYAPVLMCHACGWTAECPRCDARMTLHRQQQALRCHHCGSQQPVQTACPDCGAEELLAVGEGTERIEQQLRETFPGERILRIDRDTTRRKGSLEQALADAGSGRARILLGTQMLAKGHHFPAITLAAILDADQGLFSADFRGTERMAQLIVQVAGRAGRAERAGEVVIQTHHPDHPLLQQLLRGGYPAFARAALAEREAAGLPPFSSLALLRAEAPDSRAPRLFLERARALAEPLCGKAIQLWGPVAAPMERRAGRYRAQLMLQSGHRNPLQQMLARWMEKLEHEKTARRVRWSLDVDPYDMY
ncbi:MAG TPA: primosomal protein N' [Gammaproteobacteria bacterium]|nr:primosomal protein N' [Gammaproteobacteria bacterium]